MLNAFDFDQKPNPPETILPDVCIKVLNPIFKNVLFSILFNRIYITKERLHFRLYLKLQALLSLAFKLKLDKLFTKVTY